MRTVTTATQSAWRSEIKAGPTRPVVRATTQRIFMAGYPYNTEDAPGGDYDKDRQRTGFYRTILFGHGGAPREVPNVRKSTWSRSVDQDVATATLTVANTQVVPIGSAESAAYPDDFEVRGFLAYNRGKVAAAASRWGYDSPNLYTNFLLPDRLVRTYEGYGADYSVAPGDDPNLYIAGTWLVDDVTYDANGDITLAMRDLGRLLLDHISFPPIVPYADYPMKWISIKDKSETTRTPTGGSWARPGGSTSSSNDRYIGHGITDIPWYVQGNGGVQGHTDRAPLSPRADDYWLSTGQISPEDFVWWEIDFANPQNLNAVRLHTQGGPYKVYVSLHDGTRWLGRQEIPYRFGSMNGNENEPGGMVSGVNVNADIPFVATDVVTKGQPQDIVMRRTYSGVTKMRITFTRLRQMTAANYPFRAGLKSFQIYHAKHVNDLGFTAGSAPKAGGNYRDFTDVIRWIAAWCGWWWPPENQDNWQNFRDTHNPADRVHYDYGSRDTALVKGRIWGTLQQTGTSGIADLTSDQFDKQPLMTAISKVRDIVGYQFYVDESGGIVWRRANIWSPGNYLTRDHKSSRRNPDRLHSWVTINDDQDLLQYETVHSSRNLRERIFVGSTNGKIGAVVRGYTPLPKTGLRRVAGWLDENWKNKKQALVAGDLIAARQMFDYRRSRFTIWGNPALQMDDQFRVFERTTNETYYHYLLSISSTLDNEAGTWDYQCESHWLGPDINEAFVVDPHQLNPATANYMQAIGTGVEN